MTSILCTLKKLSDNIDLIDNVILQGNINDTYLIIENLMVEFLTHRGYTIISKTASPSTKNVEELLNFFYREKQRHYKEVLLTSNRNKDMTLLSNFISNRVSTLNKSKEVVIKECEDIIVALFEHEVELGLNTRIGAWVFGTGKCGWVIDKVIEIININNEIDSNDRTELLSDKFYEKSDVYVGLM
jgi:hypothetical protein